VTPVCGVSVLGGIDGPPSGRVGWRDTRTREEKLLDGGGQLQRRKGKCLSKPALGGVFVSICQLDVR